MRRIAGFLVVLSALLACVVLSFSAQAQRLDSDILTVRAILERPVAEIDLARAKLTIDRLVDPGVDVEGTLRTIDAMAAAVKASASPKAKSAEIVQVLRSYLYDAGDWNHRQPFRYDLSDPLGHKLANKLLANYLRTKKGNCVSMPALFVALAQRLGLDATFAASPEHLFVKYRDETGRWLNLETTSGGYPRRDELYQRDTPMTALALRNGIYMRPLSKKESVVEALMDVLFDHYQDTHAPEKMLALADLALEYEPRSVVAMLEKGQAYNLLLLRDYEHRYPTPNDIPLAERPRFREMERGNRLWFEKAEALGWREPDPGADARYLQMTRSVKSN